MAAVLRVPVSLLAVAVAVAVRCGIVWGLVWTAAFVKPVAIIVVVERTTAFLRHVTNVSDVVIAVAVALGR